MDKSAPSKWALEKAILYRSGKLRCPHSKTMSGLAMDCNQCLALEFDAIRWERDEVTEKLKRELEKAEGQLDIILRECQGDDDASLANDYGGTGWEKEVPVATVRWHRNKWKKSNEVAEKLAEALSEFILRDDGVDGIDNGIVMRYQCRNCLGNSRRREEIQHEEDCYYAAAKSALAAYRERMGR